MAVPISPKMTKATTAASAPMRIALQLTGHAVQVPTGAGLTSRSRITRYTPLSCLFSPSGCRGHATTCSTADRPVVAHGQRAACLAEPREARDQVIDVMADDEAE